MADDIWGAAVDRRLAKEGYANVLDERSAEEARRARAIGRSIGVPGSIVEADLPGFEKQAEAEKAKTLFDYAPGLAAYAAKPENAAVIKDDLPTAAEISRMFNQTREGELPIGTAEQNNDPLGRRFIERMRGSTAMPWALKQPFLPQRARYGATISATPQVRQPVATNPLDVARGLEAGIIGGINTSFLGWEQAIANTLGFGDWYRSTDYYRATRFKSAQDTDAANVDYSSGKLGEIGGVEINPSRWAYQAATSLGQLGAGIVTGQPLPFISALSGGEFYERTRARGASHKDALRGAILTGAIEAGTEKLPLEYMLGGLGKKATGKFLGGFLLREAPTEVLATVGQGAVDAMTTGGEGWDSYVAGLPQDIADTLGTTAFMGGAMGGLNIAARRLSPEVRAMDDIEQATAGATFLDKLMTHAGESKARTSDPETFKEFVESQTADTPVRELYVPVEAINEYMQSEGYEAGALEAYSDQIAEAQATQGDVVIPVADAAAYLAGTPAWEALKDKVRLQPGGLSQKEALEQHAEIMAVLEQRGAEIAKEVDEQDAAASDASEVYSDVKNRLIAGGVKPDVAEQTAQLVAARYEAQGKRRGTTAMEAWKKANVLLPGERAGKVKGRKLAQAEPLMIGDVAYEVNEDGSYKVELAAQKDKRTLGESMSIRDLRSQLGDELTARILAGEGGTEGRRVLSNVDLTMREGGLALRGRTEPLVGMPTTIKVDGVSRSFGPFAPARKAAQRVAKALGIAHQPPTTYARVDPARGARIAQAFEEMQHDPNDPVVKAAYRAMIDETIAQYKEIMKTGLKVEFIEGEDPYGNPRNAILDVVENNHLWVYPTASGFGGTTVYHGTGNVYDLANARMPMHFAADRSVAQDFADNYDDPVEARVIAAQVQFANPLRATSAFVDPVTFEPSTLGEGIDLQNLTPDDIKTLSRAGYDGVIIDWGEYIAFDPKTVAPAREDNPLLERVPGIEISGKPVVANDIFRVVHDYFGHIMEGVGFRADGEENAWRIHSAMYSPLARRAMTTETRGQNSWVNFGPHGEANRTAGPADTVYADQKIGLLPMWVSEEGLEDRTLNQSAAIGGYEGLSAYLSDEEKANLKQRSKEKLLDIVRSLPDANEIAAVAYAGRAKRGWYENSAQAILDVFGQADAPRFAALLASLSPQTSVQSNLYNALKTWTNWNEAGRPTDRKAIVEIMGRSVEGKRGTASVLNAWINNSVAALSDPEPASLNLSGPKVNSFFANLVGVVDEVTQDTWMASIMGADPLGLRGGKDKAGKGISYKAMNAVVRAAADVLSRQTGELWTPAEVQETVWSLAKTVYEMRDTQGQTRSMRQLLEAGHVTHDDIANTPDFAVLFSNGIYQTILEEGGYGERTRSLGRNRRAVGVDGQEGVAASAEGSGFSQDDFRSFLAATAERLEAIRAQRRGQVDDRQRELFQSDVMTSLPSGADTDAVGNRILAYHGTPFQFDEFRTGKAIWFSEGRGLAERYADPRRFRKTGEGRVINAEIAIQAPLDLDPALRSLKSASGHTVVENPVQWAQDTFGFDIKAHGWERVGQDYAHAIFRSAAFADAAREAGYDTLKMTESGNMTWGVLDPQAIAPQDRELFQAEAQPPFYSALTRALEANQTKRATGAQWAATLRKMPGIKQEELEWTGLLEYLEATEGLIERDTLITLVRMGGIEVDEVMLGRSDAEKLADYGLTVDDLEGDNEDAPLIVEAGDPQFQSWSSDPSNPTYRELLITLPVGVAGNPTRAPSTHWDAEAVVAHTRFMDKVDADGKRVLFVEEVQSDWHQKGRDQGYEQTTSAEETARLRQAAIEASAAVDAVRQAVFDAAGEAGVKALEKARAAGQRWDEQEIGRRIVTGDLNEVHELRAAIGAEKFLDLRASFNEAMLREREAGQAQNNAERPQGIPNAPFKSSWPALVMKRLIRYAAENGYDRVAWTTGAEQAERYNLSTAVGTIQAVRAPDGERYQLGFDAKAQAILVDNGMADRGEPWPAGKGGVIMTEDQLKAAFGNDIANRVVEGVASWDEKAWKKTRRERSMRIQSLSDEITSLRRRELDGEGVLRPELDKKQAQLDELRAEHLLRDKAEGVVLEGDDLQVGGEGMKAFYDRNLVNITNDIIKKYGAKVGPVGIPTPNAIKDLRASEAYYTEATREQLRAEAARMGGTFSDAMYEANRDKRLAEDREAVKKGVPHPGFDITDKMREAAMQGFTLFQRPSQPRGSTTFLSDGSRLIRLFETANESTLAHEFGHVWLEEMRADALGEDATEQEKADWDRLKKWWAKLGITVTDEGEIPEAAHEFFARTFERYLREGRPPIRDLRSAFKAFSTWLTRIYQQVRSMNAPINPELRGIFDRMLATEDAIEAYRAQENVGPLFNSAEEAGMTSEEFAAYTRLVANARDTAYDTLLEKTMAAVRAKRRADMREQRSNIRAQVAAEINGQPMFVALHLLRTGRWLGDPQRERQDVKLNTGWLIDTFGEDILGQLPKGLPITRGDGLDGDTVAEMVGAASGQELVHALVGMRTASEALRASGETRSLREKMVDEEVDRRMAERHGDALDDGSIEEEAIAALNTATQGEVIAAEARQLAKRATTRQPLTPYQFAREWARRKVMAGRVNDMVSRSALQRYTRATAKSARLAEAAILEGNTDEAYRQKQAQLLNHALLAESKIAADEVDTIVARMKRLAGRAAMKSVDQDYMDKIHQLLEGYDFRDRSQRSIEEQEDFQEWAERQRAMGFEVHIPPRLENRGDPYSRVTVEELMSLNDLVQSLLHLGRLKNKLKVAQQERDFNEFVDEVVTRIEQLPQRKLPEKPINEEQRAGAGLAAELVKIETLVEELDGGATGPLNDVIVRGATEAENKRVALRHQVLVPIVAAYHGMGRKMKKRLHEKVTIPELTWNTLNEGDPRQGQPVTITRSELLSIALNMGNLSNLEKLSKGERWPVPTLQAVMDRELTKEDWDLVQLLWRQVDSLWPQIVAVEREQSGVVPEKVVPVPIETRFGTYEGGYWPVVYDAGRWQRAEDLEAAKLDDMFGIKSGVATQKGHTITRTQAFGPINLSLENVLFQHLEQVVTRIAYTSFARDVLRVIRNPRIRGIIDTRLGSEYRKQVEPWLGRIIHEGAVHAKAARWWQKVLKQARINMTVAAMGFRFSTGIAQTLGLTASAQRIGAANVANGLRMVALRPRQSAEFAFSRSQELSNRNGAANREISEVFGQLRGKHSMLTEAQAWAFWHIGMIDRYMVALPTWLGAHQRGIREGMTDDEASAYADKAVRQSQGSGAEKDLAAFQSPNNDAMRFFTMFYTPFNVLFNEQWKGVRGLKKGQIAPIAGVTFWWMMAMTLADALMSGDAPDWDDEEDVLGWFGRNVFFSLFAGIPILRDAATYVERKQIGEYAEFNSNPITRIWDAIEKTYKMGDKLVTEGETPKRPIKQTADVTALLTGVPISQAGTSGQFLWDYHEGEADPQDISDWYFGITRGKVPEPKTE